MPQNSFREIYTGSKFPIDGKFVSVGFDDQLQYEFEYSNMQLVKSKNVIAKNTLPPYQGDEVCYAYYLVITIHGPAGEIISQEETFLYMTCMQNTSSGGGGGGSTGNQQPVPLQRTLTLIALEGNGGSTFWSLRAAWTIRGNRGGQPNLNRFIVNSMIWSGQAVVYPPGDGVGPNHSWFGVPGNNPGNTGNISQDLTQATGTYNGSIHFNNQTPILILPVFARKSWYASSVLN